MGAAHFITEEELERVFSGRAEGEKPPTHEGKELPQAEKEDVNADGIGTFGGYVADAIAATCAAKGRAVPHGTFDLADIRHAPPMVRPAPGVSFPGPRDLFIYGDDVIPRARRILGSAWNVLMRGNPVSDRTLDGHGGRGNRLVAMAAYVAERDRVVQWAVRNLVDVAGPRPRGDGLLEWQPRERPQVQLVDITCLADCGAVGSGIGPTLAAEKRLMARELGLNVEPYLVVLGGRVFGRGTDVQVHERIGANEGAFWMEMKEAMEQGRVASGIKMLELDEPLVPPGNVLLFDDDIRDPETGAISEEARMAYVGEVGITVALAIATGALARVSDAEANDSGIDGRWGVRALRLVGHAIDRADLADELARRRAGRMRQRLLATVRGEVA